MNKRFFRAFCYAVALVGVGAGLSSCSGDDLMQPDPSIPVEEVTPRSGEQLYRVTVQAGEAPLAVDGGDASTRASFVEVDGNVGKNYYLWETNDKLVVFANTKKLGELTLHSSYAGKRTGDFEGDLTATADEIAGQLTFVYLGKNAMLTTAEDKTSKISVDLSKQQGTDKDIVNNSILWGKGKLQAKSASVYSTVGSTIKLINPMGIYHFNITPPAGAGHINRLTISGEGIYSSADIDIANGTAIGDSRTAGYKWEVPATAKKGNAYDVYYVLAPGDLTPVFTTYDDNNSSRVGPWLGKEPGITRYTSQQALIRNERGEVSNFTAYDSQSFPDGSHQPKIFQFTRGNLQYVLGQRVGQISGVKITAKRNTLSRLDHRVGSAIPVPTTYTDGQAGEYRLAGEQWEVVKPRANQQHPLKEHNGYYYYMGDGDDTVIDLFGWGNVLHPDLAKKVGETYEPQVKDYYRKEYYDLKGDARTDYGTKVYVDGQATTMPSVNELVCILYKRKFSDDPKYSMSTRAWIDMDGNGTFSSIDVGGIVVFPDGMTKADADKCWGSGRPHEYELESAGGALSHSDWGSTTSKTQNRLTKEAIAKYGLLFLPSTGAADMNRTDDQWTMTESWTHANYMCSDWQETAFSRLLKNGYYPQQGSTIYDINSHVRQPNTRKNTHTFDSWTYVNGWVGVRLAVIKK